MTVDKTQKDIHRAAADAITLLSDASAKQLAVIAEAQAKQLAAIADATLNATKLLATQAQEAAKVVNTKGADDHDKIIEVLVKMDGIKNDIKELSDGTATRITTLENEKLNTKDSYPVLYKAGVEKTCQDFEERIRSNTTRITQIMTWGSAAVVLLGIAEFLISKFL